MRRILFPLLVIGLAAGLFTLGSGAFFSDKETDTGNIITAGTLDLQVTTAFSASCAFGSNAQPGDSKSCTNTVTNAGSLTGDLYLLVVLNETDPTVNEPECVAEGGTWTPPTTCGSPWPAGKVNDLGGVLTIAAGSVSGTGAPTAAATTWASKLNWNDLETFMLTCTKVSVLDTTETFIASFPTTFLSTAGNQYQGDTAQLVFRYELVQVGQTATCPI